MIQTCVLNIDEILFRNPCIEVFVQDMFSPLNEERY